MAVSVEIDAGIGSATLRVSGLEAGQALQLSLQHMKTRQYLSPSGWAKNRKILARVEASPENAASIPLPADLVALIAPGTPCLLEDIRIALRLQFTWPVAPVTEPVPSPEPEPPPAVETIAPQHVAEQPPAPEETASTVTEDELPPAAPIAATPLRRRAATLGGFALGILAMIGPVLYAWSAAREPTQKLASELERAKSEQKNLRSQITGLMDQLDARDRDLATATNRCESIPAGACLADQNRAERAETDLENLRLELDTLRRNANTQAAQKTVPGPADNEIATLREQVTALTSIVTDRTKMLQDYREQVDSLQASLSNARVASRAVWIAAAADPITGYVVVVANQLQKQDSERLALLACKGATGNPCKIAESASNVCVALATKAGQEQRADNWEVRSGTTRGKAEKLALEACNGLGTTKCEIRFTNCSP